MPKGQKTLGGKMPNPIDIEVGKRVRVYRQKAGLSQTQLGDALKLTFQQVQKYEKGTNRVAPSRLEVIAQRVWCPSIGIYAEFGRTERNWQTAALCRTPNSWRTGFASRVRQDQEQQGTCCTRRSRLDGG